MKKKLKNILQEKQVHWTVLLISLLITCVISRLVFLETQKQAAIIFNDQITRVENALQNKLSAYQQIAMGGVGLFKVIGNVSAFQWKSYIESLNLQKNYPGIRGVGFAQWLNNEEISSHLLNLENQGYINYKIFPSGNRNNYAPIIYLEPLTRNSSTLIGYDMYSEKMRHNSMNIARDTAQTAISDKITLLSDSTLNKNGSKKEKETGFLMITPVYYNNKPHSNIEERRKNIQGFVYIPFAIVTFLKTTIDPLHLNIGMEIYQKDNSLNENLIYNTNPEVNIEKEPLYFLKTKSYTNYGKKYNIKYYTLPSFESKIQDEKWISVLLLGGLLSVLFFILIRSLVITNIKAAQLAEEMTKELRKNKEDLENLAHYDSLTGLANRFYFNQTLTHAISLANRHEYKIALLFIDLDGFKKVNDDYGHEAGDIVLKEVAKRIKECLRVVDTVGRLGGDEFVVLIEKETGMDSISTVATNIIDAINKPIIINDIPVGVGISMGIAICPDSGKDIGSLMKNADHAMYKIKQTGKNNFCISS
jgi:diguanylate cyclase (GGDEF)-like protein